MGRRRKKRGEGEHKEKLDRELPPPDSPTPTLPTPPSASFISLLLSSIDGRRRSGGLLKEAPASGLSGGAARGSSIPGGASGVATSALPPGSDPPALHPSSACGTYAAVRGRQRRGAGGEALRLTLSGLQRNPVIICQRTGGFLLLLLLLHCPRHRRSTVEVVITKSLRSSGFLPAAQTFLWPSDILSGSLMLRPVVLPRQSRCWWIARSRAAIRSWLYRRRDHREEE